MAETPSPTTEPGFGALLRTYRLAAGLTQEELAEWAGLSLRRVSDLERGARLTPRLETVRMLADGLGIAPHSPEWDALLAARSAAAPSGDSPCRVRLPIPPTAIIGRVDDVATNVASIVRDDVRLLTLVGPGGVGKSRLALEVAIEASHDFPDGVCFVSLAPVADPNLVVSAVARALDVHEVPGITLHEAVQRFLEPRRLLLVLDNFEQVLPASSFVADLLSRCADLTILATSRAPLRIRGEHRYPVQPLALPDIESERGHATVAESAAVQLFVARAQDIWPGFALSDENMAAVAGIVRSLDGLPLALELAAARLTVLTPASLYDRLADRLAILTAGHRDAPARHQTMRSAIGWSYDLLPTESQWLFRRLAVFLGGASLEAVSWVTGDDAATVLDRIEPLIEHSLLMRSEQMDGQPRFRMLEPIRDFALERLVAEGEDGAARDAHAAWCLTLGERTFSVLRGSGRSQWFDLMEVELGNLRGAFAWLDAHDRLEDAVDLAMGLFFFFHARGYQGETLATFTGFLRHRRIASRSRTRAKALLGHGILVEMQGAVDQGLAQKLESVEIFRELGDSEYTGLALVYVGNAYRAVSDFDRAEEANRAVIEIGRETNDPWLLKAGLNNMGTVLKDRGDVEQAVPLFEETLAMVRLADDVYGIEMALLNLAEISLIREEYNQAETLIHEALALLASLAHQADLSHARMLLAKIHRAHGDYSAATAQLGEALTIARRIGEQSGVVRALIVLGDIARLEGDLAGSIERFREAITLAHQIGSRADLAETLESMAGVAVATGDQNRAARLLGAANALLDVIGVTRPAGSRSANHEAFLQAARSALGPRDFTAAWTEGEALTPAEMVAEALALTPGDASTSTVGGPHTFSLSRRELEVLHHMASGMSNQQIADALFVSHRTVTTHVSSIMIKLDAASRTAAVVTAIRHRLV